jgi:hypothetical protein
MENLAQFTGSDVFLDPFEEHTTSEKGQVLSSLLYCVHYASIVCTMELLSVLCIYSLYHVSIVFT